jgi:hypothetical protein
VTALLELAAGIGLMLALFLSLAAVAHDDARAQVAPVTVRRKG